MKTNYLLLRSLAAAILLTFYSCNTSNDEESVADSTEAVGNIVNLTKDNYIISPIPMEMGGPVNIGKGVNMNDPFDPYVVPDNFLQSQTIKDVKPVSEFWKNSTNVNLDQPQPIPIDTFRKASTSTYYETESDELMAMHLYANLGVKAGFNKFKMAVDFVRQKRSQGSMLMFIQEVEAVESRDILVKPLPSALSEIRKIENYNSDEERFSYFVGNYGSHYINNVTLGSRIFIYATSTLTTDQMKAQFSASFKNFSVNVNAGGEYETFLRTHAREIKMRVYGGKGTVDKIYQSIDEIKTFFTRYNDGKERVTLAPISCRVVSFRPKLTPDKFPNLSRLFIPRGGLRAKSPFGVPSGTIVAWYPANLESLNSSPEAELQSLVPDGWALCDGKPGTPDLSDRFVYGTSKADEIGDKGGEASHSHTGTTGGSSQLHGADAGGNFEASGRHAHDLNTNASNHLPPYIRMVYIIKL